MGKEGEEEDPETHTMSTDFFFLQEGSESSEKSSFLIITPQNWCCS